MLSTSGLVILVFFRQNRRVTAEARASRPAPGTDRADARIWACKSEVVIEALGSVADGEARAGRFPPQLGPTRHAVG